MQKSKKSFKKGIYEIVGSGIFDLVVVVFLLVSIVLFLVDALSIEALKHQVAIDATEKFITCFFIVEYALRFYASRSKRVFFFSHIIDLLAIIPLFRFFRLFLIFRLLKVIKSEGLRTWLSALSRKSKFFSVNLQDQFFEIFFVCSILVALMFIGTVGILGFEKGINEQFQTITDGIWWTVVTLTTVGYGDKFPITPGGKMLAIFLMLTGLSFFALITSFFSTFILERYRKGANKGMELATLSDHIIVCGWNSNAETVLNELEGLYSEDMKFKVVISEDDPEGELSKYSTYLKADFTKMESLEMARIDSADSVIILADNSQGRAAQDIDARTILTVLGIKKKYPNVYVCAEVVSPDNIVHIKNAGVDEFISSFEYTGNMLAHTIAHRGISQVYGELLRSNDGSQLVKVPVDKEMIGKQFVETGHFYNKEHHSVLIGVERANKFLINPGFDFVLENGDKAVLIAQE